MSRQATAARGKPEPGARAAAGSIAYASRFDARVKLVCLVVYIVAALHTRTPVALAVCAAAAIAMALATRLSPRMAAAAIRPLVVILLVTVVMRVLYIQQGAVLVQIGSVAVTQGALEAAGVMLVALVCVMVASLAFMRCTPSGQLVATFDWLLAPLRVVGVRTGPFMLALTVAFRFVPVLADELSQLKRAQLARHATFDGSVPARLRAYARLFPPLVRSSFRRADRLAETFVARCFTGSARAALHPQRIAARDLVLLAATLACALVTFAT